MATINLERKELEKYIKVNEAMIEKSTMMGVPAEVNGDSVTLEITPNRPDLLSMHGFLRAFYAYTGKEPGLKKYKVQSSGHKLIIDKSLPQEWPYAVACIVKGIKFDDAKIKEVIDIQEKLGATWCGRRKKGGIGLYPLDKINFPVRFKGIEPDKIKFRPLEYPEEITGRQILTKHPTGREYAHLVDKWSKLPVFIDSKNSIMSMPPIINSHDLGKIDEKTKDIFIEATGPDFKIIKKAINIIVSALADMGGKIYSIECIQQDGKKEDIPNLSPEKMKVNIERMNKLIGLSLKEKDLPVLLEKMGYDYANGAVSIPAWRTDVLHEVDISEDIAIAYGYDNLVPEIPKVATIGEESYEEKIKRKIAEMLSSAGLLEISSFHLIKEEEARIDRQTEKIEVENSKTDYKILRPNLIVPVLRTFSENKDNEYPQKIFEMGRIFSKSRESETGIKEEESLAVALSPSSFTETKQILDYLMRMIGIKYELKEAKNKYLIDGRSGSIILNEKEIGFIGEVNIETLRAWNIKMPVSLIEISLDEIFNLLKR